MPKIEIIIYSGIFNLFYNFDDRKKISLSHYLTLILLKKRGKLSMSETRKLIGTNKQHMTHITDILAEKELIKRVPDINDRRVINIVITDKGNEHLNKWQKNKIKEINKIFVLFDDEDLKELYKSIENIKDAILKIEN